MLPPRRSLLLAAATAGLLLMTTVRMSLVNPGAAADPRPEIVATASAFPASAPGAQ